jgi:hypothetical protein
VKNGNREDPAFTTSAAYVRGGRLVASLPLAELRISTGITSTVIVEMVLKFRNAFLVANIEERDGGTYALSDGTIAGRWLVEDLLDQLGRFPNPLDLNAPLCVGRKDSSYDTIKTAVCNSVDIGEGGPTCNAISVGIGFQAEPAHLGDVFGVSELKERCPEGLQPSDDDCDKPLEPPLEAGSTGGTGGAGTGGTGGGGTGGAGGSTGGSGGGTGGAGGSTGGSGGTGGTSSGGTGGSTGGGAGADAGGQAGQDAAPD